MKKLLKLNALNEQCIEKKQMNALRGGKQEKKEESDELCTCSCYYANNGGSSSIDNSKANYNIGGGHSIQGDNCYVSDYYNGTWQITYECNM
jgi:natural product precursor